MFVHHPAILIPTKILFNNATSTVIPAPPNEATHVVTMSRMNSVESVGMFFFIMALLIILCCACAGGFNMVRVPPRQLHRHQHIATDEKIDHQEV